MATDQKTQPRHELFVEQQLERVSKRLHTLDMGRTGLLLLAVVLAHALVMAVVDLVAGPKAGAWSTGMRIGIWGMSLTAIACLGGLFLFQLYSRINPYYAAKEIEETIPDAKNSVVNWLDLKEKPLPPVVKNAIGLRAAQDLKTTDPDQSIHPQKNAWVLAVVIGSLVLGLLVLLVREPGRFGSLMQRAFLPLGESTLATRTSITLLKPAKGDMTVAPQRLDFQVKIAGVVPRPNAPDAARLLYRYRDDEPWAEQPLEFKEFEGVWDTTLQYDQVQKSFTYMLRAGDAEKGPFQVTVQTQPQTTRFEVAYHYQPYTHIKDRTIAFPNQQELFPMIAGPRGTEVAMVLRTTRELHNGKVVLTSKDAVEEVPGDLLADDPTAFRVKFTLEKPGQLQVRFVSRAGEDNSDLTPYTVNVIPDKAPDVVLTMPGKDVELPANGTLQLEGTVNDDFGIKLVILRLELRGKPLTVKAYRPEKSFQFADGSYANSLQYRDFVVLDQLTDRIGENVALGKGDVLFYWLEATDNCEYPEPNVGRSKPFKVTIAGAADTKKQLDEQRQAERDQKDHEKRQDEELKQQEIDRKQKQDPNRTDKGNPGGQPQQAGQEQKKDWTKKDVDQLNDLAKKDGQLGERAKQELKDAAQGAKNKDVREAAREGLKNSEGQPPAEPTPQDVEKLKDLAKDQGRLGADARRELEKAKNSTNPETSKKATDALKETPSDPQDPDQKKEFTDKDVEQLKKMLQNPEAAREFAKRELKKAGDQSNNKELSKEAQEALKKAESQLTPKEIEQLKELARERSKGGDFAKQELKKAAKSDDPATQKAANKALRDAQRPQKDLTQKEIEQLKELVNDKGPAGDIARKELEKAAKSAQDPNVQKAAEDAAKSRGEPSAKDIEDFKEMLKDPGPLGDAAREALKNIAKEAKNKDTRKTAEDALKNGPARPEQPDPKKLTEKDIDKYKDLAQKQGPVGDAAQEQLKDAAKNAQDAAVKKKAQDVLDKQGQRTPAGKPSVQDIEKLKELLKDPGPLGQAVREELEAAKKSGDPAVKKASEDALQSAPPPAAAKPVQRKDLTEKEIAQLKEIAKRPDAVGDAAREQLKEAGRSAKGPDKKAIDNALKEIQEHRQADKEPSLRDVEKLKEMAKENTPLGEAAAQELAKVSRTAKSDAVRQAARDALGATGRDQSLKDVKMEEIAPLKDLAKKDGFLGEQAKRDLQEAARQARDPKVRQAAKEALSDLASQKTEEPNLDDVNRLKAWAKDKGLLGESAARELKRLSTEAKNADVKEAARTAVKELGKDTTAKDPVKDATMEDVAKLKELANTKGLIGEVAAQRLAETRRFADKKEVRQAADDALKNLDANKKDVTAENVDVLKRLQEEPGPLGEAAQRELARLILESKSEEVRDKAVQALQEKEDSLILRGGPGVLPGTGPRLIDPAANNGPSTQQGNRGQPPPGYRDIYNRWTTRPDAK